MGAQGEVGAYAWMFVILIIVIVAKVLGWI